MIILFETMSGKICIGRKEEGEDVIHQVVIMIMNPAPQSKGMNIAFMPFFYPYSQKIEDLPNTIAMAQIECPQKYADMYTSAMSGIVKPSAADINAVANEKKIIT